MSRDLFIKTEFQQKWINKIENHKEALQKHAEENDLHSKFPYENINWLIKEGYTKTVLPKSYGGEGATPEDVIILQETLGKIDGATALSIGWHMGVVGQIYSENLWDKEIMDEFAEEVLNGAIVNRAVSEADTGSPTRGARPSTNAKLVGDEYIINGVKTFTTMSQRLTHFLVGAFIPEKEALGFFLIPRETEGLTIAENWNMVGMRATESHDLVLDDVKIDKKYLVEVSKGPRGAVPNPWNLHIPAVYLGIAQAARDYAVDFANEYSPGSIEGVIADIPAVEQNIGNMELELTTARHYIYSVIDKYQNPPITNARINEEIGAAKHVVVNHAIKIIDSAMRIVGAKSLEMERPLQRYYRDIRAGLHNPPMDDITIKKLAKQAREERTK
ncbi:acyl-CoA dehydrogenase family protein [Mammaliicoccus lentus]|uniref:Acyl-CoA/acyl-ACP dehydrogenase n=1 Tax=Mammaliicoccus lentus TaxID=42858 RepID=A0AAX3W219_MAMLE|nr:acyl-CoA dehydrogenase family protein [Mammaliicoccus lentus]HBV04759.1 acyl-CoA dehydrogenase [Staphylococcus sp.]MBF0748269.1 acyl-CoA/acyl-ACP dehydrogenase [Mammaliicoccus lentus]MBW0762336.1 acyl-CoA/acyl-ACP dehydrogenase [Mammaliicoccus lentus]MBW0766491.1 acyl-CoA/acyl-ACP dehydrogenase [Mammaliicoccus lentus]MBW0769591.1 acyl-CoA/acyl-ACP dehydrogenase [Mammaliicoccus lentus]